MKKHSVNEETLFWVCIIILILVGTLSFLQSILIFPLCIPCFSGNMYLVWNQWKLIKILGYSRTGQGRYGKTFNVSTIETSIIRKKQN